MENTSETYRLAGGLALAALIVVGIAWSLYPKPAAAPATEATSTTPVATTTSHDGITASGGGFTVADGDTIELPTPPDFRAPIAYADTVSPEVRAALAARAKALQEKLAKDSFDLAAWIDLGTIRKMAGDYRGAETAWVFVNAVAPEHPTAIANLADLYMNFLHDYPKAESRYLRLIALDTHQVGAYASLGMLYQHFYKIQTTAAEEILLKGIAANPDAIDLRIQLARYYKNTALLPGKAKAQYEAAIAVADTQGNTSLAAELRAEAGL